MFEKCKDSSKSSITFENFVEFLKDKIVFVVLSSIFVFLSHIYMIINTGVGIDVDQFLNNPTSNYNWLEIGRFGLIVEKYLLNLTTFSLFYAEFLGMIFLLAFPILLAYAFKIAYGKDMKLINYIIPFISLTSPIWAEQFLFTLQFAQITFAMSLLAVALIYILKFIKEKSYISLLISTVLLVLVIGTYQSFVAVILAFIIFIGILFIENEDNKEVIRKSFFKIICCLAISFIIPVCVYFIICKFTPTDYNYLNSTNGWYIYSSKRMAVADIINHSKEILLAKDYRYNLGLLIGMVGMTVFSLITVFQKEKFKNLFDRLIYICMILVLFLTPFLLTIYGGRGQVKRSEFYIPMIEMCYIMYVAIRLTNTEKMKLVNKIIAFLFVITITFIQSFYLQNDYYSDYLAREQDKQRAFELIYDLKELGIQPGVKLYFYGHLGGCTNKSTGGVHPSSFEFCYSIEPLFYYSSGSIVRLLNAYGFECNLISDDEIFDARVAAAPEYIPSWPIEGSIMKVNDFVVVKINQN